METVWVGGLRNLAAMACALCQPVTSLGSGRAEVGRDAREGLMSSISNSTPTSAMVSSAAYRKREAARFCCEAAASSRTQTLVSPFWSKGSRDGLLMKPYSAPLPVSRPGSHLVVV